MEQRIHVVLDDALFHRARLESERQRKRIEEIVKEALQRYLDQQELLQSRSGVVAASWGALKFDKEAVRDLLENGPSILEEADQFREQRAIERYIRGYQEHPETAEEGEEVIAVGKSVLALEPWE